MSPVGSGLRVSHAFVVTAQSLPTCLIPSVDDHPDAALAQGVGVVCRHLVVAGHHDVAMRLGGAFLVDKTALIREWWRSLDQVTLICRPHHFGVAFEGKCALVG